MPSTFRHWAPTLLILATASAQTLSPYIYKGCYSSSAPLTAYKSWTYQTPGWCQPQCVDAGFPVMAVQDKECYCGKELPATSSLAPNSSCSTTCPGYGSQFCGGNGFWDVYLTGTESRVPVYSSGGKGSTSGTGSTSSSVVVSSTTAKPTPSVVTKITPGTTVVITHQVSSSPEAKPQSGGGGGGGGASPAGIAAGVVVAVVAVTGIIAALFIWLRYRKRQAEEEEFKPSPVTDYMRNVDRKTPPTSYSGTSDSRLEPAFGDRRNSHGSIADNEDYSRKILRVANPDRSSAFAPPERTSIFPPDRSSPFAPARLR